MWAKRGGLDDPPLSLTKRHEPPQVVTARQAFPCIWIKTGLPCVSALDDAASACAIKPTAMDGQNVLLTRAFRHQICLVAMHLDGPALNKVTGHAAKLVQDFRYLSSLLAPISGDRSGPG